MIDIRGHLLTIGTLLMPVKSLGRLKNLNLNLFWPFKVCSVIFIVSSPWPLKFAFYLKNLFYFYLEFE